MVKTVPYSDVKTSSEEEVAFPKEITEEGFPKTSLVKGRGTIEDGGGIQ